MTSSMTLVVDCREAALVASLRVLLIQQQQQKEVVVPELVVRALDVGDALLEWRRNAAAAMPVLLVERKTIPDLLSSFVDGRYAEQSMRLAHHGAVPPHNVVYLLEGSISAARPADRQKCLCALTSCLFFKGFSTMRTESVEDTARFLLVAAAKIARDLAAGKRPRYAAVPLDGGGNDDDDDDDAAAAAAPASYASVVVSSVKKQNMTAANIGAILLTQLPGFSAASAECVMAAVGGSLSTLLSSLENKEDRDRLRALPLTSTRRLGVAAVARLCAFLRPDVAAAAAADNTNKKKKKKEDDHQDQDDQAAAATTRKKKKKAAAAVEEEAALQPPPPSGKKKTVVRSKGGGCAFAMEEEHDE